jgi:hypothetical protein
MTTVVTIRSRMLNGSTVHFRKGTDHDMATQQPTNHRILPLLELFFYLLGLTTVEYNELYGGVLLPRKGEIGELQEESSAKLRKQKSRSITHSHVQEP